MLRPYVEYDEEMKLLPKLQTYELDSTSMLLEGINRCAIAFGSRSSMAATVDTKWCSGCRCGGLGLSIAIKNWRYIEIPLEAQKGRRRAVKPVIHALNGHHFPEMTAVFGEKCLQEASWLLGHYDSEEQEFFVWETGVQLMPDWTPPAGVEPSILLMIDAWDEEQSQALEPLRQEALYEHRVTSGEVAQVSDFIILPLDSLYYKLAGEYYHFAGMNRRIPEDDKVECGRQKCNDIIERYLEQFEHYTLAAHQYCDDIYYQKSWVVLQDGRLLRPSETIESREFRHTTVFSNFPEKYPEEYYRFEAETDRMVFWDYMPDGAIAFEVRFQQAGELLKTACYDTFRGKKTELTALQKTRVSLIIDRISELIMERRARSARCGYCMDKLKNCETISADALNKMILGNIVMRAHNRVL